MGRFRYGIALAAAKLSIPALKITKHNGTDFPGALALKICPDFLKYIGKPKHIIGVTGTNGKTTTSNMLFDSLRHLGANVTNNSLGSNISSGIATTFIRSVTFFGREKFDMAVLEIDERSARKIFPYFTPEYMIVTNLSRDSIMRNGHPGYINWFLSSSIPKETRLILNADDLLSADVASSNERIYFGIENMPDDNVYADDMLKDMRICPRCHEPLVYDCVRYSSIGRAHCPNCDFKSPEYDFAGADVDKDALMMSFKKNGRYIMSDKSGEQIRFRMLNDSTFNIYNEVAVITALNTLGYDFDTIAETMDKVNISKIRMNSTQVDDKELIVMMCKDKNSYACSRVFEYMDTLEGDRELVLLVNCLSDTTHWSENTCWLYDCKFELLNDDRVKKIIVAGDRGLDYKLRLLLAGIDRDKIVYCEDPMDAPDHLEYFDNDKIYFLFGADALPLATLVKGATRKKLEGMRADEERG